MNSENFVASIEIYAIMYRNSLKSMSFTMPAEHLVRCIMRNALNELPHKECMALDFGCGDGRHSLYLNSLGYDVLAVDVNDSAIKLVNKRISFNKNLSNIEAVKISKSSCIANFDKHFCLIVAWEVLHWLGSISEWREALDALHKTLKHDGTLILTMPKENHFLIGTAQKLKKHEYIANEESSSPPFLFKSALV